MKMPRPEIDRAARPVLVAGGAGMIGHHLCCLLMAKGYSVVCLDDLSTGHRENIALWDANPAFRFVEGDVVDGLPGAFGGVFNLASPAAPDHYLVDPVRTLRTNVMGTLAMLEIARRSECVFVQASTSEIYGDPDRHPQSEDYLGAVNPVGPRACYNEGKRAAEALTRDFRRQHGVETRIARIFNTYGEGSRTDDGRVIPNFVQQALRGEPITIYGDGRQTRSYCHVDDLVEGLFRLFSTPGNIEDPVNVGNPGEISVAELAARILELSGSEAGIEFRALPQDDPKRRCPDIGRAQKLLGWSPRISLDEGLMRTIDWWRQKNAEVAASQLSGRG